MCLLLGSIGGMVVLAGAENLMTLFVGIELLSIPLYVLCASEVRRAPSLEAGLKYLVIGSVGSATLLYGLALIYGATGATDFDAIAKAIGDSGRGITDPLLLTGVALVVDRPGLQGLGGAVSPVDARRLPGRAHPGDRVHGRGHQGRRRSPSCCGCSTRRCPRCRPSGRPPWPCWPRSRS
ncbi:MAG: proton-conducting transporter membrane subunit [Thermoleophilaceae bacterium]